LPETAHPRVLPPSPAPVFAALGDSTRLALVDKLCRDGPCSIAGLTAGSGLTRQAITKHLRVLEGAELVKSLRSGRENHFVFCPERIADLRTYLDLVSAQWDQALARLKSFVEK
jgi:DNA-binding transcriptional ArsR family regulator